MNVFDLVAKITLDRSDYEEGLSKAEGLAKSVGNGLKKGVSTIGKVGVAAIGAATAATSAFAVSAINAGKDFDSSMSQVAATMGTTVDQIGDLRDFAQEMGSTTAFSATQAADALNYMALAGYDADTSMAMLPNVLNLAAAGGIELAQASDMVTDAQSALGLTLEETSTMVDQMAKASSKTNTSVAQLGEAILTIGATARGVKGGTRELTTVLGVLADNGIKGAEGGTHLRNAILSLQTPTKDGIEALAKLGMTYEDMYDEAGNMRGLPEIFRDMSAAMEGMNQQSKDAIISGIFNKTDLAAVNALIGTNGKRWNQLTEAIIDSTGAAQAMADTQLDNLSGDITLFQSALEGAKIAVSDVLTPALREFVQFGSDGLSRLTDAFKEGGLSGAMEAFGDILSEGLTMIIDGAPKFIESGMKLIEALGQGLMDNLPMLIDSTVQIIQMIVMGLIQALPQLAEAALQIIIGLANGLTDMLPNLIPAVVDVMLAIVDGLIDHIDELLTAALQIMIALGAGLIQAIPRIIERLPEIFRRVKDSLASMDWASIGRNFIEGIAKGVLNAASRLVDSVMGAVKSAWDSVTGFLKISSPSKLAEDVIGKNWALGIGEGFVENMPKLDMVASVEDTFNSMKGGAVPMSGGTFSPVINVYGAEGQDVNALADAVMDRMMYEYRRKKVSYA